MEQNTCSIGICKRISTESHNGRYYCYFHYLKARIKARKLIVQQDKSK